MDYAELIQKIISCKDCTKESDCTYTCCKYHSKMACESMLDLKKTIELTANWFKQRLIISRHGKKRKTSLNKSIQTSKEIAIRNEKLKSSNEYVMQIQDYFYNFINGFYMMKQIPIMWNVIKMCVIVFSTVATTFIIAYITNSYTVIYYGSVIAVVLLIYYSVRIGIIFKRNRQLKRTK